MPRSKAELSRQTLRQMNIVAPEEEPSAADAIYVEAAYDSKLREWRDDGLVYWRNSGNRDTAEIPDLVFATLCDLVENEISNAYGRANPHPQRNAIEQVLLSRLRRQQAKRPSGEPTTFSSY